MPRLTFLNGKPPAPAGDAPAPASAQRQRWQALPLAWWRALPEADRRRAPWLLAVLLVAATLLTHALVTLPALGKASQDLTRLRGRSQQSKAAPKLAPPRWTGKSPAALQREVNGLQQELERQGARLSELQPRFASLNDLEASRSLYAALTQLAQRSDLDIQVLEQKGLKREERDLPPTVARLNQLAQANPYKRPLVRLEARASYRGLMQFLDGLQGLPFQVSPVWLSVQVRTDAAAAGRPRQQWLDLAVDLSL